jgi:hypothetical protein
MRRCAWLAIFVAGCGASPAVDADADPSAPTYYRDVRPLLAEHCVGCHSDGGGAPFALDDAAAVREHGPMIAFVTERRIMPPWPADSSGACQTHVGARRLPDEAIALLGEWVAHGMPEGDAATATPLPEPPAPAALRVDAVLDPGADFRPPADGDEYRCFLLDPGLAEPRYLTAFAPRLEHPEMVHHLGLYAFDDLEAERAADAFDAEDPAPGYTCFGGTMVESRFVGIWAPGDRVRRMPAGTGLALGAGRRMLAQIHYHAGPDPEPDRTRIELELAEEVDRVAVLAAVRTLGLSLAPGVPEQIETIQRALPFGFERPLIRATRLHMHTLGTSGRLDLVPADGAEPTCLLDIPRWDFHWQLMYTYQEPIAARAGDLIRLSCVFDTTSRDEVTSWGPTTEDEMCMAYFYMTEGD